MFAVRLLVIFLGLGLTNIAQAQWTLSDWGFGGSSSQTNYWGRRQPYQAPAYPVAQWYSPAHANQAAAPQSNYYAPQANHYAPQTAAYAPPMTAGYAPQPHIQQPYAQQPYGQQPYATGTTTPYSASYAAPQYTPTPTVATPQYYQQPTQPMVTGYAPQVTQPQQQPAVGYPAAVGPAYGPSSTMWRRQFAYP